VNFLGSDGKMAHGLKRQKFFVDIHRCSMYTGLVRRYFYRAKFKKRTRVPIADIGSKDINCNCFFGGGICESG